MPDHTWEFSKENIAPLRQGRNVDALNETLKTSASQIDAQRVEKEADVRLAMDGKGELANDPLEMWNRYIKWLLQSYTAGSEYIVKAVEEVCRLYAKDERYRDDIRLLRLWVRYVDLRSDKLEVFNYMIRRQIGQSWALFYVAWAITLEISHKFDEAAKAYQLGKDRNASPIEQLIQREREYYKRMAARRRRDEQKKMTAQLKRMQSAQRDAARARANHGSAITSLADAVVHSTSAPVESAAKRARVALGSLTEPEATSGIRPTSSHASSTTSSTKRGLSSRTFAGATKKSVPKPQPVQPPSKSDDWEVYVDPAAASQPALNQQQHVAEEDDDHPFPAIPTLRKENAGPDPSTWAGQTLPQDENVIRSLKQRVKAVEPFTVYKDPAISNSADASAKLGERLNPSTKSETKQVVVDPLPDLDNDLMDEEELPGQTPRPASPTINTKLAMQEVDDLFNSGAPPLFGGGRLLASSPVAARQIGFLSNLSNGKENVLGTRPRDTSQSFVQNPDLEERVLKRMPAMEGPEIHRVVDDDEFMPAHSIAKHTDIIVSAASAVHVATPRTPLPASGLPNTREALQEAVEEFLVSFCMEDGDFCVLEDDPEPLLPNSLFEMETQGGIVSLQVGSNMRRGFSNNSTIALGRDLHNTFRLMNSSPKVYGSDDDELPEIALKVSDSSNAWEYYIYKKIHERLPEPEDISRPLAFCEGRKSFLFMTSSGSRTLTEGAKKFSRNAYPEAIAMFITVRLLQALEQLHGASIIHSDVTLDNILLRLHNRATINGSYESSNRDLWSEFGILLVDFGNAVDAANPLIGPNPSNLAKFCSLRGSDFLVKDYRQPDTDSWAYNRDCYSAAVCAGKMLGFDITDVSRPETQLQHGVAWRNFFERMASLSALSSADDTIAVMGESRKEMEDVLRSYTNLGMDLVSLRNVL